jgi:dienelactone hydrolase
MLWERNGSRAGTYTSGASAVEVGCWNTGGDSVTMILPRRFTACAVLACAIVTASSTVSARVFSGSVGYEVQSFYSSGQQVPVEKYVPGLPGRRPAVLILHGADAMREYGAYYREAGQQLAQAGYMAFLPTYIDERDVQEGMLMEPQLFLHWLAIVNDSLAFIAAQPDVDPNRIAIGGFSLGGYLAVATGAVNPRVRAIVEFFGGVPAPIAAEIRRMPPVLIIHGCADTRVPVTEAHRLAQLLDTLGTPYQIYTYPGQGHSLTGEAKEDAAKKALAFLDCYLR